MTDADPVRPGGVCRCGNRAPRQTGAGGAASRNLPIETKNFQPHGRTRYPPVEGTASPASPGSPAAYSFAHYIQKYAAKERKRTKRSLDIYDSRRSAWMV